MGRVLAGTVPIHKLSKSRKNVFLYYLMFFLIQILKIIETYSRLNLKWMIFGACLDLISLILHINLTTTDPGYLVNDGIEFIKLLEAFDPQQLCPECEVIRTGRSRHCILCQKCVDRYDHHCPWINNCIGVNNHNVFMAYLIFQLSSLIATTATSIIVCI